MKMCECHLFVFVANDPSPVGAVDKAPIRSTKIPILLTNVFLLRYGYKHCQISLDCRSYDHPSGDIFYTPFFRRFR